MALINELRQQGDWLFRYRSSLPLVILLPALVVYVIHVMTGDVTPDWEMKLRFGALGVSFLGLIVRSHVIGHVAPNTSGRNTDVGQKAEVLNSTGLYSVVRHPLYVGNFLMWLGPALWTVNGWFVAFFILAYWLYYERIMYAEERFLQDKFGQDYMDWAAGRPAFVPRLSGYTPAPKNFNWRKVLRQERSGFLAMFLIFWVFDMIGRNLPTPSIDSFTWNFWSISLVVAFVIFAILKAMKGSPLLEDPKN